MSRLGRSAWRRIGTDRQVRGMLNAGHRRGASAGRCVVRGTVIDTEELPPYCASALVGLNDLPDTIMTRLTVRAGTPSSGPSHPVRDAQLGAPPAPPARPSPWSWLGRCAGARSGPAGRPPLGGGPGHPAVGTLPREPHSLGDVSNRHHGIHPSDEQPPAMERQTSITVGQHDLRTVGDSDTHPPHPEVLLTSTSRLVCHQRPGRVHQLVRGETLSGHVVPTLRRPPVSASTGKKGTSRAAQRLQCRPRPRRGVFALEW